MSDVARDEVGVTLRADHHGVVGQRLFRGVAAGQRHDDVAAGGDRRLRVDRAGRGVAEGAGVDDEAEGERRRHDDEPGGALPGQHAADGEERPRR
jgi:hypothetical protein